MSIVIAVGQVNPRLGDLQANLALYTELIGCAAVDKADLLLLPALCPAAHTQRDAVPAASIRR